MQPSKLLSFETAKKLDALGFKNESPEFGDVFYTVHQDTKQVDLVVVGSAKWNLCQSLEMYFAASATDILQKIGETYRLLCVGGKNWIVEKEISTTFEDPEYEYITESFPLENSGNPAEAIAAVFLSID